MRWHIPNDPNVWNIDNLHVLDIDAPTSYKWGYNLCKMALQTGNWGYNPYKWSYNPNF